MTSFDNAVAYVEQHPGWSLLMSGEGMFRRYQLSRVTSDWTVTYFWKPRTSGNIEVRIDVGDISYHSTLHISGSHGVAAVTAEIIETFDGPTRPLESLVRFHEDRITMARRSIMDSERRIEEIVRLIASLATGDTT